MGRITKGTLFVEEKLLKPQLIKNVPSKLRERRHLEKQYADRGTKQQPYLSIGQRVLLRVRKINWKPAVIISPDPTARSYIVRTSKGQTF
ncbi:hypothetical protein JTE90_017679 [Oedothorax gibbosus]|uniref:Uncharacterized protein n=1 Tax=Oedothorax gibbosus TaxID=931172 RepID=A0AAV6UHF2_9ARAC|nr:hypothetical protein JTE90_017679 [Oedothorax gibbosus]